MKSSYKIDDVEILLKDVTGMLEPLDTEQREKKIQSGIHYSEMLPVEYSPSSEYISVYEHALKTQSKKCAQAVANIAYKIYKKKGQNAVIVSLARAGTPIGILIKHYMSKHYGFNPPHYTISIIRGKGIDKNAIDYILKRHNPKDIQFVDGWIGKGAIIGELKREMAQYNGVDDSLAVVADPAGITDMCGSYEDFLIPSACLNATVSGLFSRTILNKDIIGENDFHGAVYYKELEQRDVSYEFIDAIEKYFYLEPQDIEYRQTHNNGYNEAEEIRKHFNISDINFIKPSIGEATRVLLRRVPYKILVKDINDDEHIGHIKKLCQEKKVDIVEYPLKSYRACGIIKSVNADV